MPENVFEKPARGPQTPVIQQVPAAPGGPLRASQTHSDEPGPLDVPRLPDQINFGTGSVASLAPEVAALDDRALVCADPVVATTPAFAAAVEALRDSGVGVVVDGSPG
jgi:uracil phosphoribosyltransferase